MTAKEDQYEKEAKQRSYLIDVKRYIPCDGCGTLIAPNEPGYDVHMCQACQNIAMKD